LVRELRGHAGGVPVLPGFDEAAVLDAHDGGASDLSGLAGGDVFAFGEPVNASQVAFGQGENGRDFEIREYRAQAVIEFFEFSGTANDSVAIVEYAIGSEELCDGIAIALVPNFFEPADHELFVLIERGYGGGGHEGYLLAGIGWSIQECGMEGSATQTNDGWATELQFWGISNRRGLKSVPPAARSR